MALNPFGGIRAATGALPKMPGTSVVNSAIDKTTPGPAPFAPSQSNTGGFGGAARAAGGVFGGGAHKFKNPAFQSLYDKIQEQRKGQSGVYGQGYPGLPSAESQQGDNPAVTPTFKSDLIDRYKSMSPGENQLGSPPGVDWNRGYGDRQPPTMGKMLPPGEMFQPGPKIPGFDENTQNGVPLNGRQMPVVGFAPDPPGRYEERMREAGFNDEEIKKILSPPEGYGPGGEPLDPNNPNTPDLRPGFMRAPGWPRMGDVGGPGGWGGPGTDVRGGTPATPGPSFTDGATTPWAGADRGFPPGRWGGGGGGMFNNSGLRGWAENMARVAQRVPMGSVGAPGGAPGPQTMPPQGPPPPQGGNGAFGRMVRLIAPDGEQRDVPEEQAPHFLSRGARRA